MMRVVMRPLTAWPVLLRVDRIKPPFRAEWPSTKQLLAFEARKLNHQAADVIVGIACDERDITLNGELRYNFRAPMHPGVIVGVINSNDMPLLFYTDQYTTWQGNARAIALTLVQLRAVKRYGVGSGNEAYVGYQQLPVATATFNGRNVQ